MASDQAFSNLAARNPTAAPKAVAAREAVAEVERAVDAETPGTAQLAHLSAFGLCWHT